MAQQNNIAQQLNDLLVTRNFHPDMLDAQGKVCDSEDAKTFTFNYISGAGKNYGTMVVILDSDNDLKAFYGDNLGRSMEGDDKDEFFDFQQHLSQFANAHRYTYTAKDLGQLKHTMQGLAAITEGLFEGYYGTRRISYAGEPTEARLMIRHNRNLGENDARFRYVESIFVETAEGERYRLPFTNLAGGRAMLEHVRQGGKPYDVRGNHICEMITELKVLTRFNRASQGRVLEGIKQGVVEGAQTYYKSLRESIKRLSSPRGYTAYFESWHPANITEQDQLVEDIKTLFVEQTIDDRIEQALPLLAKIQRGREMKEADIFENWMNTLAEGTWSLPETPEQLNKLKELMSGELIVGPDGTNATEQLYDLIGDDLLFDRISELAAQDPRANLWDDSIVQARMQELGIQMPDRAEPDMDAQPDQGVAEGSLNEFARGEGGGDSGNYFKALASAWYNGTYDSGSLQKGIKTKEDIERLLDRGIVAPDGVTRKYNIDYNSDFDGVIIFSDDYYEHGDDDETDSRTGQPFGPYDYMEFSDDELSESLGQGVSEADNIAAFESLQRMRHLSGMPLKENVLNDSGSTLDYIIKTYQRDVKDFMQNNGDMSELLYDALYDYYQDDMPYGVKKARTGDPYEWVGQRFYDDLQGSDMVDENLGGIVGEAGAGAGQGNRGKLPGARAYPVRTPNIVQTGEIPSAKITAMDLPDPLSMATVNPSPVKGLDLTRGGPRLDDYDLPMRTINPAPVAGLEVISPSTVKGLDLTQGHQELEEGCNYTMENQYCPMHGLKECWLEEMNQSILDSGSRLIEDLDEGLPGMGAAARGASELGGQAVNAVKGMIAKIPPGHPDYPLLQAARAQEQRNMNLWNKRDPKPFSWNPASDADLVKDFNHDLNVRKGFGQFQRDAMPNDSAPTGYIRAQKSKGAAIDAENSMQGNQDLFKRAYGIDEDMTDVGDVVGQAARSVTDRLGQAAGDMYEPIGNFFNGVKQGYNGKAQTATAARPDAPDQSDAETARLGRTGVSADSEFVQSPDEAGRSLNYESREGDALLARIKSLALLR